MNKHDVHEMLSCHIFSLSRLTDISCYFIVKLSVYYFVNVMLRRSMVERRMRLFRHIMQEEGKERYMGEGRESERGRVGRGGRGGGRGGRAGERVSEREREREVGNLNGCSTAYSANTVIIFDYV